MLTSSIHESLEENNNEKSIDGGSRGDKQSEEILLTEGPTEDG